MRGDGVGVGDVGEVPCRARGRGHTAGGDDGRGAIGEREPGMVGGPDICKRHTSGQRSRDGVGIDDGARVEHGAGSLLTTRTAWSYGMRGDGLGVGDVGEVPCRAWGRGHSAGGDDGGVTIGERERGMVGGRDIRERHTSE